MKRLLAPASSDWITADQRESLSAAFPSSSAFNIVDEGDGPMIAAYFDDDADAPTEAAFIAAVEAAS